MKRVWKRLLAALVVLSMALQSSFVTTMAEELDPTRKLNLFVPNEVRQLVEANEGLSC